MTDKHESTGVPGDAVFAALYFAAEQTRLPHEPSYDVERGLQRFSAWLDDHTDPGGGAAENPAVTGQERATQPAEDVRAMALSLAGIAEALHRGSLQKESAMTAIAEALHRGSLQQEPAMTAGVSTITSADTLEAIAVADTGGLVLPSYERPVGLHPPLDFAGYRSTALRHPKQPLVLLPHRLTEVTGPLLGDELIVATDADLTTQHDGEPQGQRIILTGRVLDPTAGPCPTR